MADKVLELICNRVGVSPSETEKVSFVKYKDDAEYLATVK
jgi:hypothetical protein